MNKLYLFFICCILLPALHAVSQEASGYDTVTVAPPVEEVINSEADTTLYEDEESVTVIEPLFLSSDSIEYLRRTKDYAYMKNLDSLLRNLSVDLKSDEPEPVSESLFDIGLVKGVVWVLAISAVIYLLYHLFAGQSGMFASNKKLESGAEEDIESKTNTSPHVMAQQAAARGDFRQAIRHHYAYILQMMGEKHIVQLLPQKTDHQYLREIGEKPFASEFARITLQYEYVWYGEFNLNKDQYESIENGYRKFIATWL